MSEDWNDPPLWAPINPGWVGALVLFLIAAFLALAGWVAYGS
jgi:hypothetical protein